MKTVEKIPSLAMGIRRLTKVPYVSKRSSPPNSVINAMMLEMTYNVAILHGFLNSGTFSL